MQLLRRRVSVMMAMAERAAYVLGFSVALGAILGGVNAFVPSMSLSALQRLDSPIRSASAETWTSVPVQSRSRTAASRRAQGAGISGVLSGGRFCERQGSTDALKAQMTDEEMAVDQALIARVAREVEAESGVDLEQLINPSKVINLERDLTKLRVALEAGIGNSSEIEEDIKKKELTLSVEKRSIMRGWLKNIFVGQAVITTVLGGLMAYDAVPFFEDIDLSVRVLGFWFIWLFTVPSLRARKPGAEEKVALNVAFIATPLVSFAMPFITKDPVPIYWANIAILSACYGYGFTIGRPDDGGASSEQNQPKWLKFIYKSLDFGSGQERGARRKDDDSASVDESEEE